MQRRHSWLELIFICLLLVCATVSAISFHIASLISIAHATFLLTVFLFVRLVLGRIHPILGKLFFAFTVLVLCVEITAQAIAGLHVNKFLVSLLLQPNAGEHIGFSLITVMVSALMLVVGAFLLSKKYDSKTYYAKGRTLALLLLASTATVQSTYSLLFFTGKSEVMTVRRSLPLFFAPHPFRIRKLLTPVLGDPGENPFALASVQASETKASDNAPQFIHKKNVLLIVSDSLRSEDIMNDPELVPNITKWAARGWSNFEYYSVSNCTHFSMYTMLTGKLPTSFGIDRKKGHAHSLFDTFAANGYQVSTSESSPLNWYDLSNMLFPASTKRMIQESDDTTENDRAVTSNTIETIRQARESNTPYLHMAYYYGSHFPYSFMDDADSSDTATSAHAGYLRTIREFDEQFGLLMEALDEEDGLKDTLVIFTSDHGEEFIDTGYIGHASRLSDEQIKVPLIIIGADIAESDKVRSHADLAPYIISKLTGTHTSSKDGKPIVLANCSYEHPDSFAVIQNGRRTDFDYNNGYIVPLDSTEPKVTLEALSDLIEAIKEN